MGASDYLEDALLDHVLGGSTFTQPANLYLALFTSDPTDAFTTANEVDTTVDDTAYARQAITFGAASGGEALSADAQTFAAVVYGSGAAAYDVTHIGICDASTAGNLLYHAALPASITRNTGKTLVFDNGTVKVVPG